MKIHSSHCERFPIIELKEITMYAVTLKYQFSPSASAEIAKHVQGGLIPLFRQTPGFVTYYWVDSPGGEGISLSVFDSQSGADESVRVAGEYVSKRAFGSNFRNA